MVTVVFHIIISDLWEEMNPEKYEVFLRCKPPSLGSFDPAVEDKNKLTFIRYIGSLYSKNVCESIGPGFFA